MLPYLVILEKCGRFVGKLELCGDNSLVDDRSKGEKYAPNHEMFIWIKP